MKQLITILLLTLMLVANEYKTGEKIEPINLKDQFDKEHNITNLPRTIIIAFEKESSYIFNKYMKDKNENFLNKNDMVFLADISQMPSFITTTFAIPKMKNLQPHPVLLINEENTAFRYPYKEDKLTIIKVKNNAVLSIDFASNLKELKECLK